MPDFTLSRYRTLLDALQAREYVFQPFRDFLKQPASRSIILRHDVDRLSGNALVFARMQQERGIRATYYFRVVPGSLDPDIIREISSLGHEIGYHYEDLDLAYRALRRSEKPVDQKLLLSRGIELFREHLSLLREIAPVSTICMHGSPLSPYDNKDLWKEYDYREEGIIGEPYFDTDFSEVLYLTDTGRRWDGEKVSVRDVGRDPSGGKGQEPLSVQYRFHSTGEIITAAVEGKLPDQILFTFHPQRWTNRPVPWLKEWAWQGVKNGVKRFVVRKKQKD